MGRFVEFPFPIRWTVKGCSEGTGFHEGVEVEEGEGEVGVGV